MRKFLAMVLVVATIAMAGCKKDEVSMRANAVCVAYTAKMEAGQTTPEQDKQFIKAVSDVVFQLDRAIRGPKKAEKTRNNAKIVIETGIDPSAPLRLFKEMNEPPKDK